MENKISIIIPAYNKEKYISKTLDSVLAQTYKNMEIVIVNDGSKDNTAEIIDNYAKKFPNVKVVHKENEGVTKTRIRGILEASGEWVGFVDADDYIEPTMFELLMNNALKYEADISHCGCQMEAEDGSSTTYFHNTGRLVVQNKNEALKDILSGTVYEPSLCNKIFKKNLFNKMIHDSLMDTSIKINEDLLMNYWAFKESEKSVFEDVCPYHYISTENSASKTKFTIDPLKVMKILYEDVSDEFKDMLLSRITGQLVIYSSMSLNKQKEIRKPHRKAARKELRQRLKSILKAKISSKVKVMALWAAIWPWSYRFVRITHAKLKGTYNEYMIN